MIELKATIDAELVYGTLMIFGKDWFVLVNMRTGACKRFTYEEFNL